MTQGLLLDTHILIWLRAMPEKLSRQERDVLDGADLRFASVVSLWEIAILSGLGRVPPEERWFTLPDGIALLPLRPEHCRQLLDLPPLHRDPFDRMLMAQARAEHLLLMTRDRKIIDYGAAAPPIIPAPGAIR